MQIQCNVKLNDVIHQYRQKWLFYTYLASHLSQASIGLLNVSRSFYERAAAADAAAKSLVEYQNLRGGKLHFAEVKPPCNLHFNQGIGHALRTAYEAACAHEEETCHAIAEAHRMAMQNEDHHFAHFLLNCTSTQTKVVFELHRLHSQIRDFGENALASVTFDRWLAEC